MRYTAVIFYLLTISSCGQSQSTLTDQQEEKRLKLEKLITTDKDKLIILVQVKEQSELKRVFDKKWPENVETTYNILKNENGKIIYVGEFPTSESGDWNLDIKHFFAENGKLISFEKRLSYFSEDCADGVVVEKLIELYDDKFKVIKSTKTLTDSKGKVLTKKDCGNGYDWEIDKRPTVTELTELKKIRV